MELECFVTLDDVLRAYEILEPEGRIKRSRDLLSYVSLEPEETTYPETMKVSEENDEIFKNQSSKGLSWDRSKEVLQGSSKKTLFEEQSKGTLPREQMSPDQNKRRSIQETKDSLICLNPAKLSSLRQASGGSDASPKEESSKKLGIIPDENLPYKQAIFSEEISFQQLGLEQVIKN